MSNKTIEELENEVVSLRNLVFDLYNELKTSKSEGQKITGIAVKTSDLMNGFQNSMAKAIKSNTLSSAESETIKDYIIQDLEVDFALPLIAERGEDEPMLMLPNIKSVTEESPLVRLKFKISNIPDSEE
ncbi:hypothetical protein [Ekhidna sp.]|uniref:hypothetical protein n=1 Tax=Ekhidna sp. TaxID=2608089 RepID=UPI003BACEB41